jgi:hypothetical protein
MDSPPADDVGTPLREHGIIRLEISMDDAAFMRGLEEGGDLDADLEELLDRERSWRMRSPSDSPSISSITRQWIPSSWPMS